LDGGPVIERGVDAVGGRRRRPVARGGAALASILLAFTAAPSLAAERSTGTFTFRQHIHTEGRAYTAEFLVRYDVWVLLGEPVVYCDMAWRWIGPRTPAVDNRVEIEGTRTSIPWDVARQMRVFNVWVAPRVHWQGFRHIHLPCDPGAIAGPVDVPLARLARLSEEERNRAFSFSVPTSPSWDDLFWDQGPSGLWSSFPRPLEDLRTPRRVSAADAKRIVGRGFRLVVEGNAPGTLVHYSVDANPLRAWIASQEIEALTARRAAEQEAFEAAQAQRAAARGHGTSEDPADFWATLDDPRTVAQQSEDAAAEREMRERVAELAGREREARQRLDAARRGASQAELARAQRRRALGESTFGRERCEGVDQKVAECVRERCGFRPHDPRSVLSFHAAGPPMTPEERERAAARRREREREEGRRYEEALGRWRACEENARRACTPAGYGDTESCLREARQTVGGESTR
jgi:hypothetical protein